jgi:hypothetical protein
MGYHSFLIEDIPDEYPLFIVISGIHPPFSTAAALFGALAGATEDDAAVILPRSQSEVDHIFWQRLGDLQSKHHHFGEASHELHFLIITDIHPSDWKQTDGVLLVAEGYEPESEEFAATYRRIGAEIRHILNLSSSIQDHRLTLEGWDMIHRCFVSHLAPEAATLIPRCPSSAMERRDPAYAANRKYSKVKILFLASNPEDSARLRLDQEIRTIRERLRQSPLGDNFTVEQEWAVRVSDLQSHLLRHRPHIVHFSGFGSHAGRITLEPEPVPRTGTSATAFTHVLSSIRDMVRRGRHEPGAGRIVVEDQFGLSQELSPEALQSLLTTLKDNITCVVLNACFSETLARAIAGPVCCAVGMSEAIDDKAAIAFASSYYQALGFGRDLGTAFRLGCEQIGLEGIQDSHIPKLFTAPGVDARGVFLVER